MDNKKREREIVWINTGVNTRRREWGFMEIIQRKLLTTTQSESMCMQDGEEPGLTLRSVRKTEKEFVVKMEKI